MAYTLLLPKKNIRARLRISAEPLMAGSSRSSVSLSRPTLLAFQLFDDLRHQRGIGLLYKMIDSGLRNAKFLHGGRSRLPGLLALLSCAQVQLRNQLRKSLRLDRVLVIVITLDDFLLIR